MPENKEIIGQVSEGLTRYSQERDIKPILAALKSLRELYIQSNEESSGTPDTFFYNRSLGAASMFNIGVEFLEGAYYFVVKLPTQPRTEVIGEEGLEYKIFQMPLAVGIKISDKK